MSPPAEALPLALCTQLTLTWRALRMPFVLKAKPRGTNISLLSLLVQLCWPHLVPKYRPWCCWLYALLCARLCGVNLFSKTIWGKLTEGPILLVQWKVHFLCHLLGERTHPPSFSPHSQSGNGATLLLNCINFTVFSHQLMFSVYSITIFLAQPARRSLKRLPAYI